MGAVVVADVPAGVDGRSAFRPGPARPPRRPGSAEPAVAACLVAEDGTIRDAMLALDRGRATDRAGRRRRRAPDRASRPTATSAGRCSAGAVLDDAARPAPEPRLRRGRRRARVAPTVLDLMRARRISAIPVVDDGRPAGRAAPARRVRSPPLERPELGGRHGRRAGSPAAAADRHAPQADAPGRRPADPRADRAPPRRLRDPRHLSGDRLPRRRSSRTTSATGATSGAGSSTCARTTPLGTAGALGLLPRAPGGSAPRDERRPRHPGRPRRAPRRATPAAASRRPIGDPALRPHDPVRLRRAGRRPRPRTSTRSRRSTRDVNTGIYALSPDLVARVEAGRRRRCPSC